MLDAYLVAQSLEWSWTATLFISFCVILFAASTRPTCPSPAEILKWAPPRTVDHREKPSVVEQEVIHAVTKLIDSGEQLGLAVAAYKDGVEVAHVVGGICRTSSDGDWERVSDRHLFMSYSVVKGVAAATLLALHDKGYFRYESPVSSVWPQFSAHGKDKMSIGEAVSHRGGM